MRWLLALALLMIGCANDTTATTTTEQFICTEGDPNCGDPGGGGGPGPDLAAVTESHADAVEVQTGPATYRTQAQCASGGCTVELDFGSFKIFVVCGQPTGQPIVCSSRNQRNPS